MNSFFLLAFFGCFISTAFGFTTPFEDVPKENAESGCDEVGLFSVQNATEPSDGTCVCQINAPETVHCTTVANPETIAQIEQLHTEVDLLSARLDQHIVFVESQGDRLTTLTTTMMTTLETLKRIESGDLVISRPEYEILRREIADMEALLLVLKHNQTTSVAVVEALEAELANITAVVDSLEKNEQADTAKLLAEIDDLKRRLLECQEDQENDGTLFNSWFEPSYQDTCQALESVSSPYTIGVNSDTKGAWFRDPIKDQDRVYVFPLKNDWYFDYVYIYPTLADFHEATTPIKLHLPEVAQSTSMVAYNGSLFFHIKSTTTIAKFDIELQQITKGSLPAGTYISSYSYMAPTQCGVDFAIDKSGLWVIYSTSYSKGTVVVSKVDPETLHLTDTWTTSIKKNTLASCLVMCQVLTCTNSYNTHSDQINYLYDTKTSIESFMYVPINSKYLATYDLSFNPYDQKLYGWDNGNQVVYKLSFADNE